MFKFKGQFERSDWSIRRVQQFKVRECDAARKICSESKIVGYFAGSSDVITFTNLPWNKYGCKRTSVYCKCRKTQR
jgi:hypothetical protein